MLAPSSQCDLEGILDSLRIPEEEIRPEKHSVFLHHLGHLKQIFDRDGFPRINGLGFFLDDTGDSDPGTARLADIQHGLVSRQNGERVCLVAHRYGKATAPNAPRNDDLFFHSAHGGCPCDF